MINSIKATNVIKPIGIFGGTFDPPHLGHLRLALELYQRLGWQQIRFIPCQQPVLHKTTHTSATHRLAMLQLALKDQPGLVVDDQELQRNSPSYTVDTLLSLRRELGEETPLCLILGYDLLNDLPQWQRWQELLTLAHWVIVPRDNYTIPTQGPVANLIQQQRIEDPQQLQHTSAGHILITSLAPLAISATAIRQQIAEHFSPRYLLPDTVWAYIQQHDLYSAS